MGAVPIGGGVSSSASLTVSMATFLEGVLSTSGIVPPTIKARSAVGERGLSLNVWHARGVFSFCVSRRGVVVPLLLFAAFAAKCTLLWYRFPSSTRAEPTARMIRDHSALFAGYELCQFVGGLCALRETTTYSPVDRFVYLPGKSASLSHGGTQVSGHALWYHGSVRDLHGCRR